MKTKTLLLSLLLTVGAPLTSVAAPLTKQAPKQTPKTVSAKEINWDALIPPPDPKVIERYKAGKMDQEEVVEYLEVLGEQSVPAMNSQYVKIPGYLVPLNLDKNQKATELLLVPSAGSCVHVPPPPPNQTIYIKYEKGIQVEDAGYTPYWLTGTLNVETKTSKYTDTLYVMNVDKIKEYQ